MAAFADDLAWLCTELALTKPIVIGHSMGGNVALELAARYPEIPASIVLIAPSGRAYPFLSMTSTSQSYASAF
jgi:pimeloyl-ACP methyl ester carboxylesterase